GRPRRPTSWRSASATQRSSWRAKRTTTTSSRTGTAKSRRPPSGSSGSWPRSACAILIARSSSDDPCRASWHAAPATMGAMTTLGARGAAEPVDELGGGRDGWPPADEPTLGLAVSVSTGAGPRLVEVAVDAPGAGRRRFTYAVPDRLANLEAGEAVL